MLKKILAMTLVIVMAVGITVGLSGCKPSDGNYPVTIGHTVFEEKPEKVAVLSDNLADIINYMGYSTQICAISDECTQENMVKYIKSVGSESNPDVNAIINSGAQAVLIDTPLPESTVSALKEKEISIVNMVKPATEAQISTVYNGLGSIFGGKIEGSKNGSDSYERLIKALDTAEKEAATSSIAKAVCYLYLDDEGQLCTFNKNSDGGLLLEYVGATNVTANFQSERVNDSADGESTLRLANPEFIFYDNQDVVDYLKTNATLDEMTALTKNHTYELPKGELERHGATMIESQKYILSVLYPDGSATPDESQNLEAIYGITITDDMSYDLGNEDKNIVAIQQRLIDLGYLVLEEGDTATEYYGTKSAEAVKAFQKAQGITETGIADSATLKVLFDAKTLSTEGKTVIPDKPVAQDTTAPSVSGDYDIDLSTYVAYDAGEMHEDIIVIQQRLVDLGYLVFAAGDAPTTYLGPTSQAAVSEFQSANGLTPTGNADYETLKVMFSDNAVKKQ